MTGKGVESKLIENSSSAASVSNNMGCTYLWVALPSSEVPDSKWEGLESEKSEDDRLQALDDFEMVSKCSSIPSFGLHILKSVFTIIAHRKH